MPTPPQCIAVSFPILVIGFLMLGACGKGVDPSGSSGVVGNLQAFDGRTLAFNGSTFECSNAAPYPAGCQDLAREYAAAIPDALACDLDASEACTAPRPVASAEPTWLCNCAFMVNPSRSATLDAALARFVSHGCPIGCCPCPLGGPVPYACRATSSGPGTCR